MVNESSTIMCPSSRGKVGAQLLGIRQDDGTVAILPNPLAVDDSFFEKANDAASSVEQRFRFTNKCIEDGCQQWNGKGCGVAERVVKYANTLSGKKEELPACAIRSRCRWFLQKGPAACSMCVYLITEITEQEVEAYIKRKLVF